MAFVLDEKPEWSQHRLKILIGSSLVYFLLALPMCCKGGIHLFKVFDSRCSSSLLLLSLIEVIIRSAAIHLYNFTLTPSDDHGGLGVRGQQVPGQH